MLLRIWRADASLEGAAGYQQHFEQRVLPALRNLNGFLKAYLLTREQGRNVDIEVHTLWDSLDAVKKFAGANPEQAVVEAEARAALRTFDGTVSHFSAIEYPA